MAHIRLKSTLIAAALAGCLTAGAIHAAQEDVKVNHTSLKAGDMAPDFTLMDNHWKQVHLRQLRREVCVRAVAMPRRWVRAVLDQHLKCEACFAFDHLKSHADRERPVVPATSNFRAVAGFRDAPRSGAPSHARTARARAPRVDR